MHLLIFYLLAIPQVSFMCHPGKPAQRGLNQIAGNQMQHKTRRVLQAVRGQAPETDASSSSEMDNDILEKNWIERSLQGVKGKTSHKTSSNRTATIRVQNSTTWAPTATSNTEFPRLPECQHCRKPASHLDRCEPEKCVAVEIALRIVDECSVAELRCPESFRYIEMEDSAAKVKKYDVEEIALAICVKGTWQAETSAGKISVRNIVCIP